MNQRRHCEQERYSENTSICLHSTNSFSHLADRRIPDRPAAVTGVNRKPPTKLTLDCSEGPTQGKDPPNTA
jgi:hypothetical protein